MATKTWQTMTASGMYGSDVTGDTAEQAEENARAAGYTVLDVIEETGRFATRLVVIADDDDPDYDPDLF